MKCSRITLLIIMQFVLFLSWGEVAVADPPIVCNSERISSDTAWQGEVHVPQRVTVDDGVTLTIKPGTVVRFAKDKGMWVNGYLRAAGEKERPIRFSIIGEPEEDEHWHQIMIDNGYGLFENCIFEYADVGLHSHFSQISVRQAYFNGNLTGMMFKGGPVSIRHSRFTGNSIGLVFNLARGWMNDSEITANEVGIMVRAEEKLGSMSVSNSNIYNNSRYNLKMGDFNNGVNIDVRNNWWGTDKPLETIFDDRYEPGIGKALLQPQAAEKFIVKN